MPRRPRPQKRQPPSHAKSTGKALVNSAHSKPDLQLNARKRAVEADSEASDEEESYQSGSELDGSDAGGDDAAAGSSGDEEGFMGEFEDADAPRVAQWVDEEELDAMASEEESDEEDGSGSESDLPEKVNMSTLQHDLSSLPLGALRKAQQALSRVKAISDSEHDDASDTDGNDSAPEEEHVRFTAAQKGKEKEEKEWKKPRADIPKRANKHAPTEVTSKKPVPRKKLGEDEKKVVPRDPRFLPLAGEFSPEKFRARYGFLADLHETELATLRENLKRARRMLASSPRELRDERAAEVGRLERALKRVESLVHKDRRDKVEQEALARATREEREKREKGKGAWYMKEADKKELLVKAKYEALAAAGGKGAVRKAIEKKQKKEGQKEKKRRPFARGQNIGQGFGGGKHPRERTQDDGYGQRAGKRAKID